MLLAVLGVVAVSALGSGQEPRDAILVSLSAENRVVLMDAESGRIEASFTDILGPHEIALTVDRRTAYVANAGAGPSGTPGHHITEIDLATRRATQIAVTPHRQPHDVRVSRDGRWLWVAAAPSRAILEVDLRTKQIARTFDVQRDGGWFVIAAPDDRRLFVPLLEGKGLTAVDRDSATSKVVATGGAFSGAEFSPDGREVWAIEHEGRRIHVVAPGGEPLASVPLESADFGRLQFTPDGRRVLVVQGKRLTVFDRATRRQASTLEMPLDGKVLAIAASGARAVVSNPADGKITLLDLEPLRVRTSFAAGKGADGVAWVRH